VVYKLVFDDVFSAPTSGSLNPNMILSLFTLNELKLFRIFDVDFSAGKNEKTCI
jgi:hypothetical protein